MITAHDLEQLTSKLGIDYDKTADAFIIDIPRDEISFTLRILRDEHYMFISLKVAGKYRSIRTIELFPNESNTDKLKEIYNQLNKLMNWDYRLSKIGGLFSTNYRVEFFDPDLEMWMLL